MAILLGRRILAFFLTRPVEDDLHSVSDGRRDGRTDPYIMYELRCYRI